MTINQRRTYTEMLEILDNKEIFKSRVPKALIEKMQLEKDNDWNFKYDETVALENQNILYSTKALYSYIYTKYIATEEKRKELKSIYEQNTRMKYNLDNIFKKQNQANNAEEVVEQISMTEYKESIFRKFINKIKEIFSKR